MQELEKILEEIEQKKEKCLNVVKMEIDPMEITIHREQYKGLCMAEKSIRKHMNDGWIPVEERLPDESLNSVIGWDEYRERCCFVQYYAGKWALRVDREPIKITHWRPLPGRPGRRKK